MMKFDGFEKEEGKGRKLSASRCHVVKEAIAD
jgi:hypothetical protein